MNPLADAYAFVPRFDHALDPALIEGNWDEWSRLREAHGVLRSDIAPSYQLWYILRYEDVRSALQDDVLFSSRTVRYLPDRAQRQLPVELDAPEHGAVRGVLNKYFSPRAVDAWEPRMRMLARALVMEIAGRQDIDFVTSFAHRYPTTIFLEIMGLPPERCTEFIERAHRLMHSTSIDDPDGSIRANAAAEIIRDIREVAEERRVTPRNDVISGLVSDRVNGEPMTDDDLMATCFLLYLAGLDTVASILTYVFRHLAVDAEVRHTLTGNPGRITAGVEEFLRLYSVASGARVVTRDASFAGCAMKRDDRIVWSTAAADRDPRVFHDADAFDLDRQPNPHLAFGAGRHRCLGSHLARREVAVAIEEWHRVIPDYVLLEGAPMRQRIGNVASLGSLWLGVGS